MDVVEHQAGGADPSLAKELTGLNFSTEGSSGLLMVVQCTCTTERLPSREKVFEN